MFFSKRTVKQVLAPFSQMIKELDEIVEKRSHDIAACKERILRAEEEMLHCEDEIQSAKEAQTKLLEINKSTPQVDSRESFLPEVLRAQGHPA